VPTETTQDQEGNVVTKIFGQSQHFVMYSNTAAIRAGVFDFQIHFGQLLASTKRVEEAQVIGTVIMSPRGHVQEGSKSQK